MIETFQLPTEGVLGCQFNNHYYVFADPLQFEPAYWLMLFTHEPFKRQQQAINHFKYVSQYLTYHQLSKLHGLVGTEKTDYWDESTFCEHIERQIERERLYVFSIDNGMYWRILRMEDTRLTTSTRSFLQSRISRLALSQVLGRDLMARWLGETTIQRYERFPWALWEAYGENMAALAVEQNHYYQCDLNLNALGTVQLHLNSHELDTSLNQVSLVFDLSRLQQNLKQQLQSNERALTASLTALGISEKATQNATAIRQKIETGLQILRQLLKDYNTQTLFYDYLLGYDQLRNSAQAHIRHNLNRAAVFNVGIELPLALAQHHINPEAQQDAAQAPPPKHDHTLKNTEYVGLFSRAAIKLMHRLHNILHPDHRRKTLHKHPAKSASKKSASSTTEATNNPLANAQKTHYNRTQPASTANPPPSKAPEKVADKRVDTVTTQVDNYVPNSKIFANSADDIADGLKYGKYEVTEVQGRKIYKNTVDVNPGLPESVHKSVHKSIRNKVEKEGWTNLQLMENGYAPIGPDGRQINLHHVLGKEPGPMVELPATTHKKYHKQLHGLIEDGNSFRNDPKLQYQYEKFRKNYWMSRAQDFKD